VVERIRCTERLRLEPIGPQHVDVLWLMHQDPSVVATFGPWSRDDAADRCAVAAAGWQDRGAEKWIAFDRATDEVVGRGGGSFVVIGGRDRFEIGWTLHDRHRGRGYATEIGREAMRFGTTELAVDEVVAFTEPSNRASRAVMERLGMTYEREFDLDDTTMVLYVRSGGDATSA
jgi:RimJ/RimL family protein N-acetyltransferase